MKKFLTVLGWLLLAAAVFVLFKMDVSRGFGFIVGYLLAVIGLGAGGVALINKADKMSK